MAKKTQASLFQTLGQKLRADQSPNGAAYRDWAVPTVSGL